MTKAIKKIMAWSLAFVCAATAGIAAIATNGFGLGDPPAQVEQAGHNKQLSFGSFFGNGITLTASAEESSSVDGSVLRLGYYDFDLQTGSYDEYGVPNSASGEYHMEWVPIESMLPSTGPESITIEVETGFVVNMVIKREDGTYQISNDLTEDTTVTGNAFAVATHLGLNVWKADQSGCTLEEAQAAVALKVPYFYHGEQSLTATVNELATDKSVTWSVAWKDPTSEWANGKDILDYVNVIPTSADGLTVSVCWIQAFAEQVVVTVTSVANPEISASCTVDYTQRLFDYRFGFDGISDSYDAISFDSPTNYFFMPTYSNGTLEGELEYTIEFSLPDDFIEALEENEDYITACDLDGGAIQISRIISAPTDERDEYCYKFYPELFFGQYSAEGVDVYLNNALHNVANEFEAAGRPIMIATCSVEYSCGTLYEEYQSELWVMELDSTEQTIAVTSVDLDNTTLAL